MRVLLWRVSETIELELTETDDTYPVEIRDLQSVQKIVLTREEVEELARDLASLIDLLRGPVPIPWNPTEQQQGPVR